MNYLHVTPSFSFGGLETRIIGQSNVFSDAGIVNYIVSKFESEMLLSEKNINKIEGDVCPSPISSADQIIYMVESLIDIIQKKSIKIVEAHTPLAMFVSIIAASFTGTPVLPVFHGPIWANIDGLPLGLAIAMRHYLLPRLPIIGCVSEEVRDILRGSIEKTEIVVIPNGVSQFKDLQIKYKLVKSGVLISRIDDMKFVGIKRTLELLRHKKDFQLKIVGDGSHKEELERYVDNSDMVDRISFVGYKKNVEELILSSDYVIGMGRVALEGAMAGRPTFLLGYEGPCGWLRPEMLKRESYANFSGRQTTTLDERNFHQEWDDMPDQNTIRLNQKWVIQNREEKSIWEYFVKNTISKINATNEMRTASEIVFGSLRLNRFNNHPAFDQKGIYSIIGKSFFERPHREVDCVTSIYNYDKYFPNISSLSHTINLLRHRFKFPWGPGLIFKSGNIFDDQKKVLWDLDQQIEGLFRFGLRASGPEFGDYTQTTFRFCGNKDFGYLIRIVLLQPYTGPIQGVIFYQIIVDGKIFLEEDASLYGEKNTITLKLTSEKNRTIDIRIVSAIDCEQYEWGVCTRLMIENVSFIEKDDIYLDEIEATSPYSKTYQCSKIETQSVSERDDGGERES